MRAASLLFLLACGGGPSPSLTAQRIPPSSDEGPDKGRVDGGVTDSAGSPIPPSTNAVSPRNVAPTVLEGMRVAGEKNLIPDDDTRRSIRESGATKAVGAFKLCVKEDGSIMSVTRLDSTGFPAWDSTIETGMRRWRYRPYVVDGHAVPVCTSVTFIYARIGA
jgi:hypothetical protein